MTRGEGSQSKVHYKGKLDDYIIFVDDVGTYKKWMNHNSIPLVHFVSPLVVFQTHKQGAQGPYDTASKGILASEFGTEDFDEAIKKILMEGTIQTVEAS
ncbi:SDO1-like protein C21C3.19 [Metarhizium anisopliae]|uniref:RNA-binding protein n=1 Tax=Metarhizium robertsii (strain ARSEF 23 / ATCC MYA-3075) TaxID=655844 RepID=E9F1R2_METRA|nr:RNA-binding protein [Metarhizium robertsii ARSEF 23]EFY98001.1 RNA-binding protein [Metarhizium robertsii ARSEF 23]KAF5127315.1 SDO1-like protein C21C3.19 [Metarhizium anisopliae]KAF5136485.1 SDO1-like protein C21C3.19 [Metarhizium anisopliae]